MDVVRWTAFTKAYEIDRVDDTNRIDQIVKETILSPHMWNPEECRDF